MGRHTGPVLVDTNTILDAHKMGAWPALSKGYGLETVEACMEETNTGFQKRRPEEQIDPVQLRSDMKAVHDVTELDKARAQLLASDILLDNGELCLWAHALTRKDAWVLCGPDKASMRFGVRMKCREKMISLERLLSDAGASTKGLQEKHTTKWLDRVLGEFVLDEMARKQ